MVLFTGDFKNLFYNYLNKIKAMAKIYEVCKYGNEWAIFNKNTKTYDLFGNKKIMETRAKELNKLF